MSYKFTPGPLDGMHSTEIQFRFFVVGVVTNKNFFSSSDAVRRNDNTDDTDFSSRIVVHRSGRNFHRKYSELLPTPHLLRLA
eukprot:656735-Rhodomonas_salina.2